MRGLRHTGFVARIARSVAGSARHEPISVLASRARILRRAPGVRRRRGGRGSLPEARDDAELSRSRGERRAAYDPGGAAAGGARCRSGAPDLCGARHLPDRKPTARAHRHRLQRLRAAADAARHRHHEPRALDALHRQSGPRHQIRAARVDARWIAGTARRAIQGCACAQRADQYPRLRAAERNATAIRSSCSRWPICASRISGICITP